MRIISVCLLLLTGCAMLPTQERYRAKLEQWIGRDGHDLIMKLGAPDSLMDMDDGGKLLQYNDTTRSTESQLNPDNRSVSSYDTSLSCSTWFKTDKAGKITEYGFKGAKCKSY